MKAVVQRVLEASVTVDGQRVSEMGPGLLVLLGVGKGDTDADMAWMVEKLAMLRIFEDADGKMNLSLEDTSKHLIVVSQFTLYGDARKGRRPSFIDAMEPVAAKALYERTCEALRQRGLTVGTGIFAADMKVALVNDGPVTILLESPPKAAAPA
ncbi:D-tyrosyl-tRNA(Tyr) deacylase [Corallococcus exiguus]|uniref:D-aminoacyl-tRNA deacylase n=1 Tax=Corallococcus exiguus TaxID=83462 RepID=A0A7X4Y542_9BACT|nr:MULTISPECIES: D-aminoacyl-tRNA deacylase [Corallococcus]RKI48263.1 D-tyrosyl-tRNA(Tyr) deacylase [Corallococcus sp. AB004]NBC39080.1 D-tyrosyl-tRNA(Tyr) deacylase [Corallococcus exiguus]NNB85187.1 D-tyrosyl-tRNA(Tyr) deacylase [Corallococcus exiguus]NNB94041.1 D-tyrosyl-tRNA(Tyr) deacylase [Corallococcus exiguus]NPC71241.1 D-tyrosyl-tRNA(Tyr) deacylase [Corallococcus exiguus]